MSIEHVNVTLVNEPAAPRPLARFARWLAVAAISGALALLVVGVAAFAYFSRDLPDFSSPEQYRPSLVTRVLSTDGRLIGEFGLERRRVVPYDRIPKRLVQAFVASEDGSFFEHDGIDYLGMLSAVLGKVVRGGKLRGASTITQQLAKSLLITAQGYEKATERSVKRKVGEAILARRLEERLTKEEILYIYLNQVFLGHGAYGVQAAAENYFRKSVSELNLAEMSLIAGLPQAPSRYSPFVNPKAARQRQEYVLKRMLEEGFATKAEHDEALRLQVEETVHPRDDRFRDTSPYFTEHVRRYLYDTYGEKMLYTQGLTVETTLDLERQWYAEEALVNGLRKVDHRQGFRGPLLRGSEQQALAIAERYEREVLKGAELDPEELYVAAVTEVKAQQARLKVGKRDGLLHLGGMRWARKPNPLAWWESHKLQRVTDALKVGDVILVQPLSAEKLKKLDGNWDILRDLPKDDSVQLFALQQVPLVQGALISLDPRTGYVQAMIGGYSFEESEFNRAFQACRQPGSAFKPVVYGAAIELLEYTPSTIIVDSPIVYDDVEAEKRWKPANFELDFKGDVTVRTAITNSMNIPALKTGIAVGVDNLRMFARRTGIETPLKQEAGIAIGSSCVTPWELTLYYAMVARLGRKVEPIFIKRVIDRDGNVLEDHTSSRDPWVDQDVRINRRYATLDHIAPSVMDARDAHILRYLMTQVCLHGTGAAAAALGWQVGGKTGTTNDSFDAWFLGYTANLVTGVWVGFDHNEDGPLGVREQGGHTALPIWLDYMKRALRNVPKLWFATPAGICNFAVDKQTGLRIDPSNRRAVVVPFRCGSEPKDHNAGGSLPTGTLFRDEEGL
ncbi:MAG: PBP1A family penicillin-binding protein [Deltaproteobacteria bacterium]|nr:PBP1A family penicillin-binding protein [Deltaproteobacteria bacterium]